MPKYIFPIFLFSLLLSCTGENKINEVTTKKNASGVIFETDFSNDTGFSLTNAGLINTVTKPVGWDAARATGQSKIEVIDGLGKGDNKPALKLSWDPTAGQPVVSLYKHLTDDLNTGYSELYIRYQVKLPNHFKAGTGTKNLPYWKWGRLWQNTSTSPSDNNQTWTENREDSYYIVWNFGGDIQYGLDMNITFGANTGVNLNQGSAGGERYLLDYYSGVGDFSSKDGHFQSVGNGAWDIDFVNNKGFLKNQDQTWHTIEYHIKLASSNTANDGQWTTWYDGVEQTSVRLLAQANADTNQLGSGIQTAKHGSGMNFLVFFDNMANWNEDWDKNGVDGFIYVNDVVVSTKRIGHTYISGQP